MTLNQLKYFCETCRCHSITAAANQLFVTQPAISLAIRELESEFGITLFTRFNNRLTLTEDGALFYKKADYILQYCKDMQFELNGSRIQQNPIHVGIPPVLSSFFFPGLIDAYRSKYPDALVSLEEYGSVRACDLVLEDKLDLALVNMEMYNIDQLNSHVLIHDQLVFCVSPEHPLANHTSIKAADLDHQNVILFNKDSVQNAILRTRFDFGNVHPNIIMQGNQLYTMINFIRSGTVGCFLYSCITAGLPKYKAIPMEPPMKTDIGIVWKKGRYLTTQMQNFITFVKKYYDA